MSLPQFWKDYIESYDKVFCQLPPYRAMIELAKKALQGKERILDSCTGSGNLTIELLKQGSSVFAIDQNRYGLELLEKKARTLNEPFEGILATFLHDAHKLLFRDAYFDAVSCTEALAYLSDPIQFLIEHTRVLNENGIIVLTGPSQKTDFIGSVLFRWKKELQNQGIFEQLEQDLYNVITIKSSNKEMQVKNKFSKKELETILTEEIGLRIIKSRTNPLYYNRGYFIVAGK